MTNSSLQFPRLFCSLALFMMASACAGDPATRSTAAADGVSSDQLLARIQAEVGDAACDSQLQCRTIAIGAKPCGGPDSYLAWSSKRTDEQRLNSLVGQHAAVRKQENLRSGLMSNCAIETNPGATCQAARCTLRPRGLGNAPASDV